VISAAPEGRSDLFGAAGPVAGMAAGLGRGQYVLDFFPYGFQLISPSHLGLVQGLASLENH
jgi:hypothetical protein